MGEWPIGRSPILFVPYSFLIFQGAPIAIGAGAIRLFLSNEWETKPLFYNGLCLNKGFPPYSHRKITHLVYFF
jgi:hypothetical protein